MTLCQPGYSAEEKLGFVFIFLLLVWSSRQLKLCGGPSYML